MQIKTVSFFSIRRTVRSSTVAKELREIETAVDDNYGKIKDLDNKIIKEGSADQLRVKEELDVHFIPRLHAVLWRFLKLRDSGAGVSLVVGDGLG